MIHASVAIYEIVSTETMLDAQFLLMDLGMFPWCDHLAVDWRKAWSPQVYHGRMYCSEHWRRSSMQRLQHSSSDSWPHHCWYWERSQHQYYSYVLIRVHVLAITDFEFSCLAFGVEQSS